MYHVMGMIPYVTPVTGTGGNKEENRDANGPMTIKIKKV